MKVKDNFSVCQIAKNYVVVPIGKRTVDFRCVMTLNETGATLWNALQEDRTREELVQILLDEYEVTEERAQAGVDKFLAALEEADLMA